MSSSVPERASLVVGALVCVVGLASCGAASNGSSSGSGRPLSGPSRSPGSSITPPGPSLSPSASGSPPADGSTLGTFSADGSVQLVSSGDGFSIVHDVAGSEASESNVTVYGADGQEVISLPSSDVTGDCGAQDLDVPGVGRVILTEVIDQTPAAGVEAASASLTLHAWSALDGSPLWSVPLERNQAGSLSCSAYDNNAGYLEQFGSTSDHRWALIARNNNSYLLNLATGAHTTVSGDDRLLGNYLAEATGGDDRYDLSVIGGGHAVGHVSVYQEGDGTLDLASSGLGYTDSDGTSPDAVVSSDGNTLLSLPEDQTIAKALALPEAQKLWAGGDYIWGDDNGVAVESVPGASSSRLVGFDDKSGAKLWALPDTGEVCAITSSELLLYINGQYAIVDLQTGDQISYTSDSLGFTGITDCPEVAPDGAELAANSGNYTVTQILQP